jgi:hypothetical protein
MNKKNYLGLTFAVCMGRIIMKSFIEGIVLTAVLTGCSGETTVVRPAYVKPFYPIPGPGYVWHYHPNYGWGWHHPVYGWHRGWV